eukprot:TRINITY_DN4486_c0_g1_i1.p1 TRINITY_DN4486_c0_g1~~TRINITY_DN4486_c0_g1_i1.p1  ORF type:complete len:1453 (+),score=243.59 TRINITY_DN4486_c0_g1_i1:83-4441(+)
MAGLPPGLDDSFGNASETNYKITSPYRQNPKPSYSDLEQEYNRLRKINFDLKLRLLTLEEQLQALGLGDEIPGMVMEVTGLRADLKSLQTENRSLREAKDQHELALLRSRTQSDSLLAEISSLEAALVAKDAEITKIRKSNTDLEAQIQSNPSTDTKLEQTLRASIRKLESELRDSTTAHKQHLSTCKYDRDLLEKELREIRERPQRPLLVSHSDTEVVELRAKLGEALTQIQEYEQRSLINSETLISTPKSDKFTLENTPPGTKKLIAQQRDQISELEATLFSTQRELSALEKSLQREHRLTIDNLHSQVFELKEDLQLANKKNDRSVELLGEYQLIFEANQKAIEAGEGEIASLQSDLIALEERYQQALQQNSEECEQEEVKVIWNHSKDDKPTPAVSRIPSFVSQKGGEESIADPFDNSQFLNEDPTNQSEPDQEEDDGEDFGSDSRRKTIPVFQFPNSLKQGSRTPSPRKSLQERRRSTKSPSDIQPPPLSLDLKSPSQKSLASPTINALDLDRSISIASVRSSRKGSPRRVQHVEFGTSPMSRQNSTRSVRSVKGMGVTTATSPMAMSDINERLSRSLSQRSMRSQLSSPSAAPTEREYVAAGTSPLRNQHLDATTSPLLSFRGHDMCTSPMASPATPLRRTVSASGISSPGTSISRCATPKHQRTLTPLKVESPSVVDQPQQQGRTLSPFHRVPSAFDGMNPPTPRDTTKRTLTPTTRQQSGEELSSKQRTLSPLFRSLTAPRTLSPLHPVEANPFAVQRTLTPRRGLNQPESTNPIPAQRTLTPRHGKSQPVATTSPVAVQRTLTPRHGLNQPVATSPVAVHRTLTPRHQPSPAPRTLSPRHGYSQPSPVNPRTLSPRHLPSEKAELTMSNIRTLSSGPGTPKRGPGSQSSLIGVHKCESALSTRSLKSPITPKERKDRDKEIILSLQQTIADQTSEHEEILAELTDTTRQLSEAQNVIFGLEELQAGSNKLLSSLGIPTSVGPDAAAAQINEFRSCLQSISTSLVPTSVTDNVVAAISRQETSLSTISSKVKKLSLYVQKNNEKDKEIEVLKEYIARLETELDDQREVVMALEEGKLKMEFEISKLNTATSVSKTTVDRLSEELDRKRNEFHEVSKDKNNLEVERSSLSDQLADAQQQLRLLKESTATIKAETVTERPTDEQITLRICTLTSTVENGFGNLKQFLKECGWGMETLGLSRNFLDSIQTCTTRSEEVLREVHALAKQAVIHAPNVVPKELSPQRSRSGGSTEGNSCQHSVVAKHETQTVELMVSRLSSLNETLRHHSTQRDISYQNIMQRVHTMEQTLSSQLSLIFGIASPKRARSRSPIPVRSRHPSQYQPSDTGNTSHMPSTQKVVSQYSSIDSPSPYKAVPYHISYSDMPSNHRGGWQPENGTTSSDKYGGISSILSTEPLHRSTSPIQQHIDALCSTEIQRIEQIGSHWDTC